MTPATAGSDFTIHDANDGKSCVKVALTRRFAIS